jgi:DNA-binding transcriptional LysR family regulator
MDRFQAMQVFIKVANTHGFAEAARQLLMSPPSVTRAIAMLETMIGSKLFTRTTRSVNLTEAGQRYYEDCKRILADVEEAENNAAGLYATPSGTLTISAPVIFGQLHVLPVVTKYLDLYPAVAVRTLFLDRIANLVDEGIDAAVRIGHLPDSGLHATPVGNVRRVLCAAPQYLEQMGMPNHPAELSNHKIIASVGAWTTLEWQFGPDERIDVNVHPRLICNTNEAAISAALSGWGITRVLSYQIHQEVKAGKLKILLPDYEPTPLPIHVVYVEGRSASARVRSFVDLAARRLRAVSHDELGYAVK